MKKKRALQVIGVGLLGAMLVGCSAEETGGDEVTETETTETEEIEAEDVSTEVETEEEGGTTESSRTEPLELGETAVIKFVDYDEEYEEIEGEAKIILENAIRGQEALDTINKDNYGTYSQYEDEEGYEWAVFDLTFELVDYVDGDTPYFATDSLTVVNEDGSQVPGMMLTMKGAFPSGEIYEGATSTGKVAVIAPIEGSYQIKYEVGSGDEVWYHVE